MKQMNYRGFLRALSTTGNVTAACRAAKVPRCSAYKHREEDPEFAAAWDEALDEAADRLEEEARRRAVEGVLQKKFTKGGEPIIDPETGEQYVEHVYSDTLLTLLLKAHRPEKFRERFEHTGKDGEPLAAPILISVNKYYGDPGSEPAPGDPD